MKRNDDARIPPWALVSIALGFFLAAFLCYNSYTPANSFFHSWASPPGWIAVVMFWVIGIVIRLVESRYRKHDAENAKRNAQSLHPWRR